MQRNAQILLLFFISGVSALIYEVLWVRQLTLVFGNTVQATTTVLCAFMAGLALGSYFVGRWIDRSKRNPLQVYAILEFGIGALALLFPFFLQFVTPLYRAVYQATDGTGFWLVTVRFFASFAFLVLPTALMGGTLPALGKYIVAQPSQSGSQLGSLYAINTFGGVAGTVLCGFAFIPNLGTTGTNLLAVTLNAIIGGIGWSWSRASTIPDISKHEPDPPESNVPNRDEIASPRLVMTAYFISGFAALALEVVCVRVLLMVFGSTTYAFTVMLATFLTGIAAGAAIARRWVDTTRGLIGWFGLILLANGAVVAGMVWMVEWLPTQYLRQLTMFGMSWAGDTAAKIVISIVLMALPTLLFGATFPIVAKLQIRATESLGHWVGAIYAANTVGAIFGSVVGGFVLLPFFGMQISFYLLATLLCAVGAITLGMTTAWSKRRRMAVTMGCLSIAAGLIGAKPPWNQTLLSAGIYMQPQNYLDGKLVKIDQSLSDDSVLYYAEGKTATVAVVEVDGVSRMFRVDGKTEISNDETDRRIGRMLGHIPALLHPNPKDVFNLGLGGGLTVSGLAAHPVNRMDVAEFEPLVADCARFFAEENRRVLDDSRLHLILNDGRNHLLLTNHRYDIVTSDPLEPIVAGAANLFTREHFLTAKARLNDGGLMCQWIPLYEVGTDHYNSILNSFASVFPHVTAWFTGADSILIGSEKPIELDFEKFTARLREPRVHADLQDIGLADPYRLLGTFLFEITPNDRSTTNARLNTDRFPFVEFGTPKVRWRPTIQQNIQIFIQRKQKPWSRVRFPDDASRKKADEMFRAQQFAMQATFAADENQWDAAADFSQKTLAMDPENPFARNARMRWHMFQAQNARDPKLQIKQLEKASAQNPNELWPITTLAVLNLAIKQPDAAAPWVARAIKLRPNAPEVRLLDGQLAAAKGDRARAESVLRKLAKDYPRYDRAQAALAELKRR